MGELRVVKSADPTPRASIIEAAKEAGLTEKRAESLLQAAEGDGLAHRWTYGPRNPVRFATVPQPTLGVEESKP